MSTPRTRIGGHVVVDCLERAGVEALFGVPGIHSLSIWDGLVGSPIRNVGMRTELAAGFAADGYARAGSRPGVLLTTTGPGSLVAACALMEARTSYVPVVNIVSQVPRDVIGSGRGFLHELPTQSEALAALAKWHAVAHVGRGAARAHRRGVPPGDLRRPWPGRAGGAGRRPRGRDDGSRARALRRRAGAAPAPGPGPDRRGRAAAGRRRATRAVGRRRRAARRRLRTRSARSPSSSTPRPPRRTWARARSRPTTRSRSGRRATRARSRSCCAPPTSCSPSAPSWEPRRPASGRSSSRVV